MNSIERMPDFGSSLIAGESIVFPPFGAGPFSVAPRALRVAMDGQGAPILSLQMVKRADDLSADGQYAVFDVQLVGDYALDEALQAARARQPGAVVKPAPIEVGYARLVSAGSAVDFPDELTHPEPLGWSCSDGARWTRRLDRFSGELI